jgi:hypothetical protein
VHSSPSLHGGSARGPTHCIEPFFSSLLFYWPRSSRSSSSSSSSSIRYGDPSPTQWQTWARCHCRTFVRICATFAPCKLTIFMAKGRRNRSAPSTSARDARAKQRGVASSPAASSPHRVAAGIQKSRTLGLKAELNTHTRIALALHATRTVLLPSPCLTLLSFVFVQACTGFANSRYYRLA